MNPKFGGQKADEGRRFLTLFCLAGVLVILLAARDAWTIDKLRNENSVLLHKLAAGERLESKNLELLNENQSLKDFEQTAMDKVVRLESELQQLRAASNLQMAEIEFGLQQLKRSEQENQELEARAAGKPRVPRVGGWLGMNVADVQNGNGIMVKSVVFRSPAARADVQEGDIVESVDGSLVPDAEAFKAIMVQKSGGQIAVLDLIRDNARLKVEVTPTDWPQ
jgi:C-terminal processing protease CtpA/Prc